MKKLQDHPLSEITPVMSDDELQELAADIKLNKLHHPIVLLDEKILDGRNRYRACLIAGIEPDTVNYRGDNPMAYVFSEKVYRQHLNSGQRAMLVAKFVNQGEVTQGDAAKVAGVSRLTVNQAAQIASSGDKETIAKVESGKLSTKKAVKIVQKKAPKAKKTQTSWSATDLKADAEIAKAFDRIEKVCGKEVRKGIQTGAVELTWSEVLAFTKEKDAKMRALQNLIVVNRWTPKRALAFLDKAPGPNTTLSEMENYLLAEIGPALEVRLGKFLHVCKRVK